MVRNVSRRISMTRIWPAWLLTIIIVSCQGQKHEGDTYGVHCIQRKPDRRPSASTENPLVPRKHRRINGQRICRLNHDQDKLGVQIKVLNCLMEAYDWRIRAPGTNTTDGPVDVTVNMYLRTISKVDDVNMEYSIHFTFREEWTDSRLSFNNCNLSSIILPANQTIWMPDTFFQNEKDGRFHTIDKPNVMLRIQPNGRILYSVRLTLTMSCPMNLKNYPLDTQHCNVDLASYAYTVADIIYKWKGQVRDAIQIKEGLNNSLPSFTLSNVSITTCTSKTATGQYSCLRMILFLQREFSYYLLQLYIPSLMLVSVSWVSFWLDKDSVPARVTLGVTTLLTMTTQASGINAKLPPVSYTKAIDVWIGVCLAFIFGALLEFALVNYAARKDFIDSIQRSKRDQKQRLQAQQKQSQPLNQSLHKTISTDPQFSSFVEKEAKLDPFQLVSYHYATKRLRAIQRNNVTNSSSLRADRYQNGGFKYDSCQDDMKLLGMPPEYGSIHEEAGGDAQYNARRVIIATSTRRGQTRCPAWLMGLYNPNDERAKQIDVLSRYIFPVAFAIFNAVYWATYLLPYLSGTASMM